MSKYKIIFLIILLLVAAPVLLYLFRSRANPNLEYLFNMRHSPAYKAFSPNVFFRNGQTLQPPVAGSIARGYVIYDQTYDEAKGLVNPAGTDAATLARGKKYFEIFCALCHGAQGSGGGSVTPPFPTPPMLTGDNARQLSDGEIFYIATHGRNLMPSYASQIEPATRWQIIRYVRQLQQEQKP